MPNPLRTLTPNRTFAAAIVGAAAVLLGLSATFRTANSPTYDEPFYLVAAGRIAHEGTFAGCANAGVAPLPVLLAYAPAVRRAGPELARTVETLRPGYEESVAGARRTAVWVFGVPLLAVAAVWAYRRSGSARVGGFIALACALSPTIAAHASLATTDACFALLYLVALASIGWHAEKPTARRFLLTGVVIGLAIAAKYTAVILFACGFLVGVAHDGIAHTGRWRFPRIVWRVSIHALRQIGLCVTAWTVAWLVTGCELADQPFADRTAAETPAGEGPRVFLGDGPAADVVIDLCRGSRPPLVLNGFLSQLHIIERKAGVLLKDRIYPDGHPLYYAHSALWKSTPAELILLAVCVGGVWRRKSLADPYSAALIVGGVILVGVASASSKQLGLRYILPAYPIVFVLASKPLAKWVDRRGARRVVLLGLLVWQGVSFASVFPHPLSYFNTIGGNPENGYRRLGDSDSDWGQGMIALRVFLERERADGVIVFPHAWVPTLESSGVRSLPHDAYESPPCRYIAVSRSRTLKGPLVPFRMLTPVRVVGYTIAVYDAHDPDVWRAYQTAVADLKNVRRDD